MINLKQFLQLTGTLLASSLILGCSTYQPTFDKSTLSEKNYTIQSVTKGIVFSPVNSATPMSADLYLPDRNDIMPVVITIHGGGWSGRSRQDMSSTAESLAQRGYAVFNISYRFAPEFTYPAQLTDVQQALQWIDNNAEQYRFDRQRINTWGYSSGAHLAALVASLKSPQTALPNIRSVVAGGIPADLSVYSNSPIIIPFIGGARDEKPETYRQASPISHITPDHPPVFLYHGKIDKLVEYQQSVNYHAALEAQGVNSELYLHKVWGHFAMFLFGWDAENKAIDFLDHHNTL